MPHKFTARLLTGFLTVSGILSTGILRAENNVPDGQNITTNFNVKAANAADLALAAQWASKNGISDTNLFPVLAVIINSQGSEWQNTHTNLYNHLKNGQYAQAAIEIATGSGPNGESRWMMRAPQEVQAIQNLLNNISANPAPTTQPEASNKISASPYPIIDSHTNIDPAVAVALWEASKTSGLEYSFLVRLAFKESSLGKNMGAPTSSARGLMQITESTMRECVEKDSEKCGLGYMKTWTDEQILAAREDHSISAKLAAGRLARLSVSLKEQLGRDLTQTDLYILHLKGRSGARRFFESYNDPNKIDFPAISCTTANVDLKTGRASISDYNKENSSASESAACANGTIFFERDDDIWRPRTNREIYDRFAKIMGTEPAFTPVEPTAQSYKIADNQPLPLKPSP